jgi:hypothetical protein
LGGAALTILGDRRMDIFADAAVVSLAVTLFVLCFGLMELCDRI